MKPKGKKWVWRLILILIVGGFIVFAAVKCEGIIRRSVAELSVDNDANAAWIGSLASYWGGILGGIFSGIIAVIGVFYTIQFTREADRRKERQGIQPFLNVKIVSKPSGGSIKQFKIADDPKYVDGGILPNLLIHNKYRKWICKHFNIWNRREFNWCGI